MKLFMVSQATIKKIGTIFLVCLLSHVTIAQKQFVTYSCTDKVSARTGKAANKIQPGSLLTAEAIINLGDDGAITFITEEGTFFSITVPGNYSLKNYYDSCHKTGTGTILNNYARYIWAQSKKQPKEQGSDRMLFLPNYHVVVRGIRDIWIHPFLDTVNYSGNGDFSICWKSYTDAKKYRFSIYTKGDMVSPVYDTIISGSSIRCTEITNTINKGSSGYWGVSLPGEESDDLRVFNNISKKKYDTLLDSIRNLQPVFEGPAERAFRTAFILENAFYFAEAQEYYATATILAPSNTIYWNTMRSFKKEYEIK